MYKVETERILYPYLYNSASLADGHKSLPRDHLFPTSTPTVFTECAQREAAVEGGKLRGGNRIPWSYILGIVPIRLHYNNNNNMDLAYAYILCGPYR